MGQNDDMNIDEILKRIKDPNISESTSQNNYTMYQYRPTSTEYVMENPEQFIIPECIECCKLLWSKGIDTYQCGNYEDPIENGFWIEIDTSSLSDENKQLLNEISIGDSRVFFNEGLQGQHNYIIRVGRINNPNASKELCDIANNLLLQDTVFYTTVEDLLDKYKRVGGVAKTDEYGYVYYDINPERKDASLDDVIKTIEYPELFVPEEGRLYHNQHALNVHLNYLNQIEKSDNKHL